MYYNIIQFGSNDELKTMYNNFKKVKITLSEISDLIKKMDYGIYRRLFKLYCYKEVGKIKMTKNGLHSAYAKLYLMTNRTYDAYDIIVAKIMITYASLLMEMTRFEKLSTETVKNMTLFCKIKKYLFENPELIRDVVEINNYLHIKLLKKGISNKFPVFNKIFIKDVIKGNSDVLIYMDDMYLDIFMKEKEKENEKCIVM